jgi:peroxiredoxin Q/BCP
VRENGRTRIGHQSYKWLEFGYNQNNRRELGAVPGYNTDIFKEFIMLNIGDMAPDFELLSDEGAPVKLSDYRGQRVILFFYPKAATPGCTTQACGFRDNYPVIEANGATVLGISPDAPEKLAQWRAKEGFPYSLLSDPEHEVAEAYAVWGEKKMYGRAYMGIIRSHFVIDAEGKVTDVQYKISPKKSIEKAVKFIQQ